MADVMDASTRNSHVKRIERAQTTSIGGREDHETVVEGSTPSRSVERKGNAATMAHSRTCQNDETHA